MCGICGVFRFDSPEVHDGDRRALSEMGRVQRHRGPDDEGAVVFDACALGSQRLSILDLSPHGHMPMQTADGRLALVHNGEIYNYLELRTELQGLGWHFESEGDTEVVLRAYQQWGADCAERFVGMWAFALYDRAERSLILSRDRFGIKPLYLDVTPDRLTFASEIKALVAYRRCLGEAVQPALASIATYAITGQVDGLSNTFFRGITRFPAGCTARVNADGMSSPRHYWDLADAARTLADQLGPLTNRQIAENVRLRLAEAVRMHLRSDVPLGVCLSGGLDSSAVLGLASADEPSVKTFTVYFADGPEFDERQHARRVVNRFQAESHEQLAGPEELLPTLQRIVWHLDEPSLALGVYPQWKVMELAHHWVKVVLDGQGGDELFGGYMNYFPQFLYGLLPGSTFRFASEMVASTYLYGWTRAIAAGKSALAMRLRPPRPATWDRAPDAALLAPELCPLADMTFEEWRLWPRVFDDWLNNVLYWELVRTRLPALLRYEDRLSMAFSLESRVPFLDHRLVELAFALPGTAKVHNGWSKFALRRAMADSLPAQVVWRRDKKGFPTPVGRWLADERGAEVRDLLRSPQRRSAHLFNSPGLTKAIAEHERGQADRSWQLWRALSVELWFRAFDL